VRSLGGEREWDARRAAARLAGPAIVTTGALAAVPAAAATATRPWLGVALLVAVAAAPIALGGPALSLAALAAVLFVQRLAPFGLVTTALLVLVGAHWLQARRAPMAWRPAAVPRALTAALVGFLLWIGLSLAWARNAAPGESKLGDWVVAAALFGVVATTIRDRRHVLVLARAFVAGAVATVLIGLGAAALMPGSGLEHSTWFEGRLSGGGGDPNLLAAGIVAAAALAIGLLAGTRRSSIDRGLLLAGLVVLMAGLGATQSRGGVIAAIAAAAAAIAFADGGRRRAALAVAAVAALVAAALLVSPGGMARLTTPDSEGNGRADLWRVGGRLIRDHPLTGVGLANFPVRAADVVREPGQLRFAELITERPHEAHNTYLQLVAEVGWLGLLAYLAVVALALRQARRAQRRLTALGERDLAALAHSVLVGAIGMLVAVVFVTDGDDLRLWILLGLGPALLAIATSRADGVTPGSAP
jgi:O-antigen ligase